MNNYILDFFIHSLVFSMLAWIISLMIRRSVELTFLKCVLVFLLVLPYFSFKFGGDSLILFKRVVEELPVVKTKGTAVVSPELTANNALRQVKPDGVEATNQISVWYLFYGILTLVLLWRVFSSYRALKKVLEKREALTDEQNIHIEQCWQDFGVLKRLKVIAVQNLFSPLSCGFLKPYIVLPFHLANDKSFLKPALAHEYCHIKNGDTRFALVQVAASVLYFFNPFVYLINRRLDLLQEISADAGAVEMTGDARSYCDVLVDLVEQGSQPLLSVARGMASPQKQLANRLESIVSPAKSTDKACFKQQVFLVLTTIIVIFFSLSVSARGKTHVILDELNTDQCPVKEKLPSADSRLAPQSLQSCMTCHTEMERKIDEIEGIDQYIYGDVKRSSKHEVQEEGSLIKLTDKELYLYLCCEDHVVLWQPVKNEQVKREVINLEVGEFKKRLLKRVMVGHEVSLKNLSMNSYFYLYNLMIEVDLK